MSDYRPFPYTLLTGVKVIKFTCTSSTCTSSWCGQAVLVYFPGVVQAVLVHFPGVVQVSSTYLNLLVSFNSVVFKVIYLKYSIYFFSSLKIKKKR